MNDLWQFNVTSRIWKWLTGAQVGDNPGEYPESIGGDGTPPPRQYCAYWLAANGELFLFGGQGTLNETHTVLHFSQV